MAVLWRWPVLLWGLLAACQADQTGLRTEPTPTALAAPELVTRYQQAISPESLAAHVHFLASDLFEGRASGSRGQKLAARYLAAVHRTLGLAPAGSEQGGDPLSPARYFQPFRAGNSEARSGGGPQETENVLAYLEGVDTQLRDQVIVITAHYDHLGIDAEQGEDPIFNGAADDASGTAASLELARAFARARAEGFGPRRSLLFLHTSGEEEGRLGSAYFTDRSPLIPLERIVANINMDGIGGVDPKQSSTGTEAIYIISSDLLSRQLRDLNERVNEATGIRLGLDYTENFDSDHRNFEKHLIPYLYYSTGFVEHYHKPSDEPNTLDYGRVARVARLVFALVWEVANRDDPPEGVDPERRESIVYVCPPCPVTPHNDTVHETWGRCPTCGMDLVPVETAD